MPLTEGGKSRILFMSEVPLGFIGNLVKSESGPAAVDQIIPFFPCAPLGITREGRKKGWEAGIPALLFVLRTSLQQRGFFAERFHMRIKSFPPLPALARRQRIFLFLFSFFVPPPLQEHPCR